MKKLVPVVLVVLSLGVLVLFPELKGAAVLFVFMVLFGTYLFSLPALSALYAGKIWRGLMIATGVVAGFLFLVFALALIRLLVNL